MWRILSSGVIKTAFEHFTVSSPFKPFILCHHVSLQSIQASTTLDSTLGNVEKEDDHFARQVSENTTTNAQLSLLHWLKSLCIWRRGPNVRRILKTGSLGSVSITVIKPDFPPEPDLETALSSLLYSDSNALDSVRSVLIVSSFRTDTSLPATLPCPSPFGWSFHFHNISIAIQRFRICSRLALKTHLERDGCARSRHDNGDARLFHGSA